MKFKPLLSATVASLALLTFTGVTNVNAAKTKWHTGLPKIVTRASMWVTDKKEHGGYSEKSAYRRYFIYTPEKSIHYVSMGFHKSGKAFSTSDTKGIILTPQYKKVAKNTYLITPKKVVLGEHISYRVTKEGKKIKVTIKDNLVSRQKKGQNLGKLTAKKSTNAPKHDPLK